VTNSLESNKGIPVGLRLAAALTVAILLPCASAAQEASTTTRATGAEATLFADNNPWVKSETYKR
jgi:hypothetical protein